MNNIDYLPDSKYLNYYDDNCFRLYSCGNLVNGMYYRVNISRKNNWVCWVYRPNGTVYAAAIVGSDDYEKLRKKISYLCKYYKKNKKHNKKR